MPEVTIIIPVYNCEDYVETSVDSALLQTGVRVEVIVVDDGSTDGSLTVLRKFGNRVTIIEQKNQGACVARNVGARSARGRFIKFLDADDYLLPGALQAQYAHAMSLPPHQFSYGRSFRHIEADGRIVPHSPRDARIDNNDRLDVLLMDPPLISAMMYPAYILDALSGFDDSLIKRQDYDLFARALIAGFRPVECRVPIFSYRSHDSFSRISLRSSRDAFANQIGMFQRQYKLLKQARVSSGIQELRNGLARTIWVTARNCLRAGYEKEATIMFEMSNSLAGRRGREGKLIYRALVTLLGPLVAENCIKKAKALRT